MLNDERFRAAQRRFEAYWQGEELDRCLIAVTAPVGAPRPARRAAGLEARWTGAEAIYEDFTSGLRATWYGGEALPIHWPNLGPGVVSAFVGGGYRFTEDTVWFSELPGIERMDAFDDLRLDKSGAMYCHAVRLMRTMAERSKGRYLVAMTDLGGGLDIAASLMGVQPMLYAMADEPERVEALLQAIDRAWTDAFRDFCALLA
ncbi:MAG: hypothetical protein GX558_10520, partial [Clostridiales bacterium]|nr:hypothetical protein [Clostridiales bacterium]